MKKFKDWYNKRHQELFSEHPCSRCGGTAYAVNDRAHCFTCNEGFLVEKSMAVLDEFVFFFSHGGKVYGTGESGRLMFAKMKDKKDPDNTLETTFTATDLKKCLAGEDSQTVFGEKDLPKIKVISDRAEVEKRLK